MAELKVEDPEKIQFTYGADWVRFLARVTSLKKGFRYTITLEVDPRLGPSWSIVPAGKIERGRRLNGDS